MKLRNKKTGEIIESACIGVFRHQSSGECERVDTEARSLEKVLEEWEDYKPSEINKYYMINEETGYVVTFDSEYEMKVFDQEIKGWRQVKVLLDGENEPRR